MKTNRKKHYRWLLYPVVAATMLVPSTVFSEVDTSEWKCELCPFDDGNRARYRAGAEYVSDDAAKFGNGNGQDEKGAYLNLDGEGYYAKDDRQLRWSVEDLGLDSRVAKVAGGRQGVYDLSLGYRELPYRLFDTTRTIHVADASGDLRLPPGWVSAPQTGAFTALAASLQQQDIESDRSILELGAAFLPSMNLKLFGNYQRQKRDGVDIVTGSGYTQASFLARPIDHHTDQIDLGASFEKGAANLTVAYYGSFFRNDIDSLTWDRPFSTAPGATAGRMAREPDNDFQQFSVSGNYRATSLDTLVAFSAALGRGEQNAALLPYTINPDIAPASLPRQSLDGKIDTSRYALTVTSRPVDKLRLKLSYRQEERDNRTPQSQWSRVITDNFLSGATETNLPYSYKRAKLSFSGNLKARDKLNLSAGFDRTKMDRDYQEVSGQTEDSGWGRIRWRPNDLLDISARAGAAKRDIDRYDGSVAASFGQNPLLRKYNLAYRYREFAEMTLAATPIEKPYSIGVSMLYADDAYTKSSLGLTGSMQKRITTDVAWMLSDNSSLFMSGSGEMIDADQRGSEFASAADWHAGHQDRFYHLGGGFRVSAIADKFDAQLDYTRSVGRTEIEVAGVATNVRNFPNLESVRDALRLTLNYQRSDLLDIQFDLRYESFESSDWAIDGVFPDTLPTVLTMGAEAYDYNIWALGLSFNYRMGGGDILFPE
ncbi:MAG: MtrB/PioB family decaheme-associated outer membrane protein [Gammaproteobacteria bacterium]|nr:MtrB/PioB family decaheme-associated outer membrane protein [Gammaproteobacteria bacterium]